MLEKAENRKDVLDRTESQLASEKEKLEKDYDVTMRMLQSAQKQMDKAIEDDDMVGIQVSREMIEAATNKLQTASKHREEQNKIKTDLKKKRKIAFNKLFKAAKKAKE